MRILVDLDLCEGYGVCEKAAPDVFAVDDDDRLQILLETPPPDVHEATRKAVERCPKGALTLVDTPD